MLISVLIPCFNEKDFIEKVVEKVINQKAINKEIIIIDDGSTDGTTQILKEKLSNKVNKIIYLDQNQGKGNAIIEGLKYVGGEVVIIQDADLEYDPNDYGKLLAPFYENDADVVYGSRFIDNKKRRVIYFIHTLANKLLTFFVNCLLNLNFTDVETGYKVFKTDIIKNSFSSLRVK